MTEYADCHVRRAQNNCRYNCQYLESFLVFCVDDYRIVAVFFLFLLDTSDLKWGKNVKGNTYS